MLWVLPRCLLSTQHSLFQLCRLLTARGRVPLLELPLASKRSYVTWGNSPSLGAAYKRVSSCGDIAAPHPQLRTTLLAFQAPHRDQLDLCHNCNSVQFLPPNPASLSFTGNVPALLFLINLLHKNLHLTIPFPRNLTFLGSFIFLIFKIMKIW